MSPISLLVLVVSAVANNRDSSSINNLPGHHRTPTIAILSFVNSNQDAQKDGLGISVAAMFGTHLKNETSFSVLERSQIARVVGEQALSGSGLTDTQRQQLGRLQQVEVILTGEVSRFGALIQMDARLVSVETGQVLVAEYASVDGYAKLRQSVVEISKALEMKYLRRWMGDLSIAVQPVEAEVYLEDQFVGKASPKEPLRVGDLLEGRYAMRVLAAGYSTVTDTVQVGARGIREIQVALRALPGSLRLSSEPSGAAVRMNGREVGTAPTSLESLPEGRYHLSFSLRGFKPMERDVDVKSGQQSELKAVLDVLPGRLLVSSQPPGADVYLDERRIGSAPVVIDNIVPGTHPVRLEMPGRTVVRDAVTIRPGEEAAWSGAPTLLKGALTVVPMTDSVFVRIFSKGRVIAALPAPFHKREMDIGDYEIEYSRCLHDTARVLVSIRESKETRSEPSLREKTARLRVGTAQAPADVWVDGAYMGRTGRAEADLAKGSHAVRWSGYFSQGTDSVSLVPDERRDIVVPSRNSMKARWMIPIGVVLSTLLLFAAGR